MKDNKKLSNELSNELNNDALESIAGGAKKDWGFFQKIKLKSYMKKHGLTGDELKRKFEDNINNYSPAELKAFAERKGRLDDELNKILS